MIAPFHGLLCVDTEGFSRHPDAQLPDLYAKMRAAAERAFDQAGLLDTWRSLRVDQTTGDGFLAIVPHDAIPALIYPFADHLQEALATATVLDRLSRPPLRLRVALHCGLIEDADPAVGAAPNDVSRLLDSEPVRAALRDSDPAVTLVAMILSSEVFDMYVQGGHCGLKPSQFTPVRAKVKQFDRIGYLYVPVRSAREAGPAPEGPHGQPGDGPSGGTPPPRSPNGKPGGFPPSSITISGDRAQNVIGSNVSGGLHQHRS
jgi:hypothetical protein